MSSKFYVEKIQSFKENTVGVDYVIGDVHGRYDLVYQALAMARFNEETDRLFCVGDLIDRGEYSSHVAEFLKKPFVYAVRGNHEDILLSLYEDEIPTEGTLAYYGERVGLSWWLDVPHEQRMEILEALKQLPLVIEVGSHRGKIGLIHADVEEGLTWDEFKDKINNNEEHIIQETLWGRKRLGDNNQDYIQGIGRIYVGHTVQDNVKKLGNVVAIDTGAVFNQHLTMVSIAVSTQILNKAVSPKYLKMAHDLNPHIQILKDDERDMTLFSNGNGYKKFN